MFDNFKALVFVLVIAWVIFALAKPLFLRFTAPEDFSRRRAVWFVLTITAFLSPSFWLYFLIAGPLVLWAATEGLDAAGAVPAAVLRHSAALLRDPDGLIKQLFAMSNVSPPRVRDPGPGCLALCRERAARAAVRLQGLDVVLLAVRSAAAGAARSLRVVDQHAAACLPLPPRTATWSTSPSAVCLPSGDSWPMRWAGCASRRRSSRRSPRSSRCGDGCSTPGYPEQWGQPNTDAWLFRGERLRAQASTGHSITLGYVARPWRSASGCTSGHTQTTKVRTSRVFAA